MAPWALDPGVDGSVTDGDGDACVEFRGKCVVAFMLSESTIKQ